MAGEDESEVQRYVRFMKSAADAMWRADRAMHAELRAEYLAIAEAWDRLAEEASNTTRTRH